MFRRPSTICESMQKASKLSPEHRPLFLPNTRTIKFNFVCKWKLIFQKLFDFAMSINNSRCCGKSSHSKPQCISYTQSTYTHACSAVTSLNHQSMTKRCNKFSYVCTRSCWNHKIFQWQISEIIKFVFFFNWIKLKWTMMNCDCS